MSKPDDEVGSSRTASDRETECRDGRVCTDVLRTGTGNP